MRTLTYQLLACDKKITLIIISASGEKVLLKTPLRITADQWNPIKQRPKNIYLKKMKKIDETLNRLSIFVLTILKEGKKFCHQKLQRQINKLCREKTAQHHPDSLLHHVNVYITSREHLICISTLKRYRVFQKLLQRFEGHLGMNLMVNDINAEFVRKFISFGQLEQYSHSTIYRSVNFVRTVLNFLEKRGIRTFVYELEMPRLKLKRPCITLSEKEIMQIKNVDIPKHLQAARDWLVISCYTGQRISDFMNFQSSMLKSLESRTCISFRQLKTQKDILLPLHPTVSNILARNEMEFPKKLQPYLYNSQIKEVLRITGFDDLVNASKRTGHRSSVGMVPKYDAASSHIGRRSFASNFYGKIPTALLMEATGHTSERVFMNYINQVDIQRIMSLGSYLNEAYLQRG